MNYLYYISIFVLVACSFQKPKNNEGEYVNKEVYKLRLGEEFKIYYSHNSCCYLCLNDTNQLLVKKVKQEKIEEYVEEECVGCNAYYAITFKAIKKGNGKISTSIIPASSECEDTSFQKSKTNYQIIVE